MWKSTRCAAVLKHNYGGRDGTIVEFSRQNGPHAEKAAWRAYMLEIATARNLGPDVVARRQELVNRLKAHSEATTKLNGPEAGSLTPTERSRLEGRLITDAVELATMRTEKRQLNKDLKAVEHEAARHLKELYTELQPCDLIPHQCDSWGRSLGIADRQTHSLPYHGV